MKEPMELNWHGMLTTENIEAVVNLLKQLLEGKRYTFVTCNESFRFKPEVRTGQRLTGDFKIYRDESLNYAGFNVGDSYGMWGCSTNTNEARYDHTFQNPYFSFEWHKVTITHRAPAGYLLYWCLAVEIPERE